MDLLTTKKIYYLFRYYMFIAFFLSISFNSSSQTIILEDGKEINSLGSSLSYYIQADNDNYSIEDVSNPNFESKWLKNPSEHLNLGYENSPIWLKIEVENKSQIEDWNLVLDLPYIDSITFHEPSTKFSNKGIEENRISVNKWKTVQTGWYHPYKTRINLESNGFIFPLNISHNQKGVYYLYIQSSNPLLFPLSIHEQKQVIINSQSSHIGYGIYFGIMLVMLFYNLIIFIITKDKNYIYYVFSIVSTFCVFGGVSGYLFKYIYPNYPIINTFFIGIAMISTSISTGVFAISFLNIKEYSKWLYRIFLLIFILSPIAFILDYLIWDEAVNNITALLALTLLVAGIYCWIKGNRFARFYTIAWTSYIIGGLMITLRNAGSLPINFWTSYGAEIGSALEVILISIALADRYRIIKKEKEIATEKALKLEQRNIQELEEKVKERTIKLNDSNEELSQINEELSINIETVENQKTEIELKSKDITDSINYAKRIQEAILPSQNEISAYFKDSFTFYLPKDVVSGDFYFFLKKKNYTFLAVADCTGHGVPGSLMAMIGINLLREIITENDSTSPAQILMNLHQEVVKTLKQQETGNRDGMDISLCVINKSENKIYFSGAKNPLISIKNEEVIAYKGSRFSIGGSLKTEGINFKDEIIEIDNQTSYYMYSDGYQDQFGGERNKKFMRKNLKALLQKNHKLPFQEQKEILDKTLFEWKEIAQTSQIDDILVMGFKV
ncbi:serine phosphatase RsbU, regulator of sigma subunit [Bernardetia litoralis DSM 6794]|uniref:Serine phosphatase RsbU, regulator of sigma subunit n=1 Tax=Bernardetia litoralis (strain ATCC 23117 / DSM 6794 / NBRC 15988 / NCIMB 1366 / Fx l1 / Sio-4) TaxID=880071 RepID=I4AP28_BERLS|nr:7TM diverse intracellular signaling domain-containing protein [Bernardetia litoralis]AFM05713.1 serine phosphatase RsbU, regulator of sigma subunit [Bernardetia litoralis DSM 6794]